MSGMKILIVRISSMGDVLQTLPAITDAAQAFPNIEFHWLVEEGFTDIPSWHPTIKKIIPVALRRWRKHPLKAWLSKEWHQFKNTLRTEHYDYIIDPQGLIKTALLSRLAGKPTYGLDWHSAREALASLFYKKTIAIKKDNHVVTRTRQFFATTLNYSLPNTAANYGIDLQRLGPRNTDLPSQYIVCITATTWVNKHYPRDYWLAVMKKINQAGFTVVLPWGNEQEQQRVNEYASQLTDTWVSTQRLGLTTMANILLHANAVISVDTGLGHIAAALAARTVMLYGPTSPTLVGTQSNSQINLPAKFICAPCLNRQCHYNKPSQIFPACFTHLPPEKVWETVTSIIKKPGPLYEFEK